jgi:hypothetical protein
MNEAARTGVSPSAEGRKMADFCGGEPFMWCGERSYRDVKIFFETARMHRFGTVPEPLVKHDLVLAARPLRRLRIRSRFLVDDGGGV